MVHNLIILPTIKKDDRKVYAHILRDYLGGEAAPSYLSNKEAYSGVSAQPLDPVSIHPPGRLPPIQVIEFSSYHPWA